MKARIIGTGSYLPEQILSNADLEKMVETSDEWIVTRTGMKERRVAKKEEQTSDMGVEAAKRALDAAQLSADQIDLILVATITPDYVFPSTACIIQSKMRMTNAAALDIQAACTGYIYGLSIAKAYIEAGLYNNILIVAAEKLSSIVNYKDRNTCVLFGDGAAACVVSGKGKGLFIRNASIGADGDQSELLIMHGGGSKNPATQESVANGLHYLSMGGQEVFKHAVRRMETTTKESLDKAGITEKEISWLVPHQANIRIIEALAKRFEMPMEKVYVTIHKYGNTSASSIGIALDELMRQEQLKEKENIILTAFGAGFTWGSAVLTYGDHNE